METTVITNVDLLYSTFTKLIAWSDTVDICVAWATSSKGHGRHWQALDLEKVRRAVVGTAFAQTEPEALVALNQNADCLRLMINTSGTFHPKVILGRRGNLCQAIVGSANLTTAAFTQNIELSMFLQGDIANPAFKKIQGFINNQWSKGQILDDDWLIKYTRAWEEAKRKNVHVPGSPITATTLADLNMTWDQYVAVICGQEGRLTTDGVSIRVVGTENSYLRELELAHEAFRRNPHFAAMTKDEKDLMLGFGKLSGGFLGNLRQARDAKRVVKETPWLIGDVLDRLPLEGPVSKPQAKGLIGELTAIKGVKWAVATRLLALKRPDLFVSLNAKSKEELARLQGGKEIKTVEQYIEVLNTLWATEWHRAKRPQDKVQAALWDCRVAILDAALYGVL